ncbi:prephenate dehydrogenase/arogenate dehydrogenase family protein, partial [Anaerobutyricum hallii]|nr:prephenate dehydrogenase/arogenate dehydrogenase family protein [Anaerobutyricum hallii]
HIPDQPGTIATGASLVAFNIISLTNIGIIYNREFEEGVLEIVLYDEESCQKCAQVLEERNYMVHIR